MSEGYLLDSALILLSTKFFGIITKKFKLPQVVGALVAGVIMGPAVLNIVHESDFISKVAELGVIVLMFNAGLESNIEQLKSAGKDLVIIALLGVLVPLVGCFLIASIFNPHISNRTVLMQNIFVGAVFTATSVSITVETLREMGKMSTKSANAVLGAAIVDDVMGIIVLTVITSITDPKISIVKVLGKVAAFFVVSIIAGMVVSKLFGKWVEKYNIDKRRFVIAAFVVCLLLSYSADTFFGVADITGAYIAGLILSRNKETDYLSRRFDTLSYILLTPIFFASIGIDIKIPHMGMTTVIITLSLAFMALITKIIGCGIGAKVCGYNKNEVLQVGVGMIPRGEVALVIASKGMKMNMMNDMFLTPIIITVIIAAISAPILLKFAYAKNDSGVEKVVNKPIEN